MDRTGRLCETCASYLVKLDLADHVDHSVRCSKDTPWRNSTGGNQLPRYLPPRWSKEAPGLEAVEDELRLRFE